MSQEVQNALVHRTSDHQNKVQVRQMCRLASAAHHNPAALLAHSDNNAARCVVHDVTAPPALRCAVLCCALQDHEAKSRSGTDGKYGDGGGAASAHSELPVHGLPPRLQFTIGGPGDSLYLSLSPFQVSCSACTSCTRAARAEMTRMPSVVTVPWSCCKPAPCNCACTLPLCLIGTAQERPHGRGARPPRVVDVGLSCVRPPFAVCACACSAAA